ncbi:hypothetical protein K2B09_004589 [Salmonella enterica subsp. enterica]|nr:hypothetical protein [Salmonella enterica subsp. enterica]EHW9183264.1 hypothetical protein [Salmonella enterica subsp. enterica]EKS4618637.1 hypothetical protein [Salmonella enterica]EKS4946858.1 hypothetical protein [Salmonella enterica]
MRIDLIKICLIFALIGLFPIHANSGARGYKVIFIDLSDGLGINSLRGYESFLKENANQFDDKNINCWRKRIGTGYDSIKKDGLDNEYFNKSYILSVLTKKHNSLIKLQEAMANTEMDFGYGGISIAGADGVYVFQKINGGVILYGIPLEGTRIISARLNLSSETIIPVDMFDALMCKVALSMDGYFSP